MNILRSTLAIRRTWQERRLPPLLPLLVAILLVFCVIFAPLIAPHSPVEGSLGKRLRPPIGMEGVVIVVIFLLWPSYARLVRGETLSLRQQEFVALARALTTNPDCVVLDEPVSALDVSIRAQLMNLLRQIQDRFGVSYLLIAHDLAVVKYVRTLLVNSKTRGKVVLHTTFKSQRDRVHFSGETHSSGDGD
jgi:hypothetical protein